MLIFTLPYSLGFFCSYSLGYFFLLLQEFFLCLLLFIIDIFKRFFNLPLERRERREKKRKRNISVAIYQLVASHMLPTGHASNLGPGLQPRHVPWLGIEVGPFRFADWCSVHWDAPARALCVFFIVVVYVYLCVCVFLFQLYVQL